MSVLRAKLTRVIKDRRTGKYYVAGGVWAVNAREARVFENLSRAFETAQNDGLKNCCIVVFRGGIKEVDAQFPID